MNEIHGEANSPLLEKHYKFQRRQQPAPVSGPKRGKKCSPTGSVLFFPRSRSPSYEGSGRADREGYKMASYSKKRLAELEMDSLRQNNDIPEISLIINEQVQTIIKRCDVEGREAEVADYEKIVKDSWTIL
jgi:hypothetical protein